MNEIVNFLTHSFYGGTDLEPVLAEVWCILAKEDYRLADVLVISDFEVDDLQPQTILQIRDMQARNVQFHSLLIGDCCNSDVVNRFDQNWRYDYQKRSVAVAT